MLCGPAETQQCFHSVSDLCRLNHLLHLNYIYCALVYLYSEEAQEYIEMGTLNGLFVLGRTMGFIGECNCTNVL